MIVDARRHTLPALVSLGFLMLAAPASAQVYIDQIEQRQVRDPGTARSVASVTRDATEASAVLSMPGSSLGARTPDTLIVQTGVDNQASVSGRSDLNRSQQIQTGNRNVSSVSSASAESNISFVQTGNGNVATTPTWIQGRGNEVQLKQRGDNNEAGVSVAGGNSSDNQIAVNQQGNGNQSMLTVSGREANVVQSQTGTNLSQSVSHIGIGRTVTIQQFSLQR